MTLDVYRGRKTTTQQQQKQSYLKEWSLWSRILIIVVQNPDLELFLKKHGV